jgi:hypothetical protein
MAGSEGIHRIQTTIFRDCHAADYESCNALSDENGNPGCCRHDKVVLLR